MVNSFITLLIVTLVVIGIGLFIITASAAQHPEPVEVQLQAYIILESNTSIKSAQICVDVYCYNYDGSSIYQRILITSGTYPITFEYSHDSVCGNCVASGQIAVPTEKDGSPTNVIYDQYDVGSGVSNNNSYTSTITIPDFGISTEPTPEPIPFDLEQRVSDLENRVGMLEDFETALRSVFR